MNEPNASIREPLDLIRRYLQWWLVLALIVTMFWLLRPILAPFLIGGVLAYFGDPIVDRLEKLKLSRTLSVTIVFTVVTLTTILILLLLVPVLLHQLEEFVQRVPDYMDAMQARLGPFIERYLGIDPNALNVDTIRQIVKENWGQAQDMISSALVKIGNSSSAIIQTVINAAMIPLVTFYLLRDWDLMMAKIRALLPRRVEGKAVRLAGEADEVLSAFVRGQLLVMLGLGTIYSLGLMVVGLDFALLIGVIAGLVSFVPFLGSFVGILAATVAMWFQTGELIDLVWIGLVFGLGQLIESWILTPWLVGDRIGMHPVAVIFAVMAGGQLFGFVGVLIALPVAAVMLVILRYMHERYVVSEAYRGEEAEHGDVIIK